MLQTWNEALVEPRVSAGADLVAELTTAAWDFETTMSELRGGTTLRAMLESGERAGEAHRLLAAQIRRRGSGG